MQRTNFLIPKIYLLLLFIFSISFSQSDDTVKIGFHLKKIYFHHTIDSLKNNSLQFREVNKTSKQLSEDKLVKRGMIVRGISIASNTDFSLNSAFRLDLSGKLSKDVDVIASLTDQNIPIQPQGNTQTLREIDNVFISVKGPKYRTTFGDLQYTAKLSPENNLNRKVQGALIEYQNVFERTNAKGIIAVNRGVYTSNIISPIDGIQGPYKLYGKNNLKYIIIIAGTEKVYLDGLLLNRGEQNDYIIEYSTGELTFSSKNIVTSYSRIVIDFEYSERNYARSLSGLTIESNLSNSITFNTSYHREVDDIEVTTDFILSEDDKNILRSSSDSLIGKSGVLLVGRDSITGIGKGDYVKKDTIIENNNFIYYSFLRNSTESIYSIKFTFIGYFQGDYEKVSSSEFKFIGIKKGSYLPLILIPKPEKNELLAIQSIYKINDKTDLGFNFQGTRFNENTLKDLTGNEGSYFSYSGKTESDIIKINDKNLGKLSFNVSGTIKNKNFNEFDRIDEVDFNRKWNISSGGGYTKNEFNIIYSLYDSTKLKYNYGINNVSSTTKSNYNQLTFIISEDYLPKASFLFNKTVSNNSTGATQTEQREFIIGDKIYFINPTFSYREELNKVKNELTDSLLNGSYSFQKYIPTINFNFNENITSAISHEYFEDKKNHNGVFDKYSIINKSQLNFVYSGKQSRTEINSSYRQVNYYKNILTSLTDENILFYRMQSRIKLLQAIDLDLYGDNSQEKGANFEKRFIEVKVGEGKYRWIDGNKNNVVDYENEQDFEPTRFEGNYNLIILPTDKYDKINNTKLSWRSKIRFNELINNTESSISFLNNLSHELLLKVERKGKPTQFVNYFKSAVNTDNVLHSNLFAQQNIFYKENNRDFNMRYRFLYREGVTTYLESNEINFMNEHSLRTQIQLLKDIALNIEVSSKLVKANYKIVNDKNRNIDLSNILSEISYRPIQDIEIVFKLENGFGSDKANYNNVVESETNLQSLRLISKIFSAGQFRFEIIREEGKINSLLKNYLNEFYLLQGKQIGKTYFMNLSTETRLESNLVFSLYYLGRINTFYSNKPIHSAKIEVRMMF
ncbi:MAG: hypothetical protein O3A55_01855 [Bacteroidetes bacterium]|nr:hypothetical protein [Bacteroidota bacterium]